MDTQRSSDTEGEIKNELTITISDSTLTRLYELCRIEYRQPDDEISFLINAQFAYFANTGQDTAKDLNKR